AIVEHYKKASKELKRAEDLYKIDEFKIVSGIGAEAKIGNNNYKIGGANLTLALSEGEGEKNDLRNIYLFENEKLIGEIEINDKVKDNAKEVIDKLKDNYELALVSGDNKFATERTAGELGIGNYYYQIMPDKKEEIISQMQREKKIVAMVGDGINDAPSLSKADLGIAIGTGQDIAIQSADVILVKGELENLLTLFKISNKTIRIIKQNIFWAFFYNAAAIPIAAGVLVPAGISVSPVMAAMLMAVSDIITVLGNSMRLKYVKLN
ncbi:MAG: HAD-IC family P-type ATPase, partial [Ignavibacteria bacterium]